MAWSASCIPRKWSIVKKSFYFSRIYSIGIPIAALAAFGLISFGEIPVLVTLWPEILLATSLVLWLSHFSLNFRLGPVTLIHALTLTTGLSLGIAPALFALTVGIIVYITIDFYRHRSSLKFKVLRIQFLDKWIEIWSRQVLANSCGLLLYFNFGGQLGAVANKLPEFWPFLASIVGFSAIYLSLFWLDPDIPRASTENRQDVLRLITLTLAPAPVVLLAAGAYAYLGSASYVLYCIILAVSVPIISSLIRMENKLSQRAKNLGLISELSNSIASSRDPEAVSNLIIETSISIGCGDRAILELGPNSTSQEPNTYTKNLSKGLSEAWSSFRQNSAGALPVFESNNPEFISPITLKEFPEDLAKLFQSEGIMALTYLPLQTLNSWLGSLTIFSSQVVNFNLRRRELLQLFSSQATFALTNAIAHASAGQVLNLQSDQLSRLEEINRQLTTSSASDNLHEIILDHAIEATSANWGYLALYRADIDKLEFVAHTRVSGKEKRPIEKLTFEANEGIFGRAFQSGQILNVPIVSTDSLSVDPLGTGAKSILCIPVCGPEAMLGVIGVESVSARAFNPSHEQFLAQLAAYAANALHHASIYKELQERLTEQSLLYQASTQIAESLESDAVGLAIADSLRVTLKADIARIFFWSAEDQSLTLMARIDHGRPSSKPVALEPDINSLLGHAQCIKDRVSMQWSSGEEVTIAEKAYLDTNYGKGRLLLLPLSIGERTLGIVEVFRKDITPFSISALRSAQSIAIQASIAIDNTELFLKISESHNRLSAILNSTREGILLVDTRGIITMANRQMEAMIGITAAELLQQFLNEPKFELPSRLGYSPQELDQLVDSLKQGQAQLAGTATFNSTADPGKTYFRIDAPVYDTENQLIGWLISLRDITEEKEVEETREQLTEMIVHDLRSPLTAILNSLVLMRRELEPVSQTSAMEQALAVSDRSVNQMLGLVNSLLDIARLESGKLKISTEKVLIKPFMVELQERFQLEANTIGIILKPEYEEARVTAKFDREKIQRVLANLIDNALKFTPVGGIIELGFSQANQEVTFWVSDTGPGIPPEFREKIFERYIQIPGKTGRRRGTGLGLAFAKLAVEAHGGKLWVDHNDNGGSVFKFSLPEEPQT